MIERKQDLWKYWKRPGHFVCISTNGFLKSDGCAVMGRGCALQAVKMLVGVDKILGDYIRKNGNVPGHIIGPDAKYMLGILPVKHNFWEQADIRLIQRSVDWLWRTAGTGAETTFHVPRLGCGNGQRDWEREVKPLMKRLPDNVVVHF